jgi:cellulose biosynthesis protein BcsQ
LEPQRGVGPLFSQPPTLKKSPLSILGIIPTRYTCTNHAREVIQRTKQEIGDHIHVFEPPVHESTRFREATGTGKTIFDLAPEIEGAKANRTIAQEIVTL